MTDSNSNIMSIGEMIDCAFGDQDVNIVNHKLLQAILYLLARQLRLLERQVEIEIGLAPRLASSSSLCVTEVKIHAMMKKKKQFAKSQGRGKEMIGTSGAGKSTPYKTTAIDAESAVTKTAIPKQTISSSDKPTTEQPKEQYLIKSTAAKSTADQGSTEKSTPEKSFIEKTPDDRISIKKSIADKISTEKLTADKISTEKFTSDKTLTEKTSAGISASDKLSKSEIDNMEVTKKARKTSKDYHKLLEVIEEQREKELRIIHQRGNSREEPGSSPTPIASLDSVEAQYEKLLIVERVPSDEARRKLGIRRDSSTPKLSVVTQEQFAALSATVRALQEKFTSMGVPGFPENIELMQELRKGASLTDAMAALQLSARLEATEKTIERMLTLVTELVKATPGMDLTAVNKKLDTENLFEDKTGISKTPTSKHSDKQKSNKVEHDLQKGSPPVSKSSFNITLAESSVLAKKPVQESSIEKPKETSDCVTYDELDSAIQELYDDILNTVKGITARSTVNADSALKIATKLERVFDTSLNLGTRMDDLEVSVAEYTEQINALDTGFSSQMTNYQEQLTQMQHDLESGLENMAEVLASTGGDTNAVAELNGYFTGLQADFDNMSVRQKDLKDLLDSLSLDLEALWKHIELLRDTKSDRDEVVDALRDKAGIEELNGLVSLQQFDAVRGDFEKRIAAAYDKFNNQEILWQKAIDELLRELNEKADYIQVVSLRDEINKYLNLLNGRMNAMFEIVGEPNAATVMRKLFRDSKCLSCSTPAHMNLEEPNIVPALPAMRGSRPPTIGAEAPIHMDGEGDQRLCFPGQPIPHPRDPRAHLCQRYCGGSHTVIKGTVNRVPPGMIISPMSREATTGLGVDGRPYIVDDMLVRKPCLPCNVVKPSIPQTSVAEQAPEPRDTSSDMTPSDYNSISPKVTIVEDNVTPPANFDED